jgi:hypothetical protein
MRRKIGQGKRCTQTEVENERIALNCGPRFNHCLSSDPAYRRTPVVSLEKQPAFKVALDLPRRLTDPTVSSRHRAGRAALCFHHRATFFRAASQTKLEAEGDQLLIAGNNAAHGADVQSSVTQWAFAYGPKILAVLDDYLSV